MQKWIFTTFSALAMVTAALTGCSAPEHQSGFIDKSGKLIVNVDKLNPKPIAIGDYSEGEGLAPVQFASGCGCLDKSGTIVFTRPFRHISQFSEGKAAYSVGDSAKDEKWGYINKKGETVIKPIYAAADKFSEGVAAVRLAPAKADDQTDARWTYIDESGKQIFQQTYDHAGPFSEGLAAVKLKGRMGSINRLGAIVVPAMYDVVYACNDGNIVAAQGNGLTGQTSGQALDYYNKSGNKLSHAEIHPITLQNLRPLLWVQTEKKSGSGVKEDEANLRRPLSNFASPGFAETKSISQAGSKFCIAEQFNARAFKGGYDYIFPVSGGFCVVYDDSAGGKMDYRGGIPEDASGIWNSHTFRFWDAAPFSDGLGLVQETVGLDQSINVGQ
jgi:hypothetical protein